MPEHHSTERDPIEVCETKIPEQKPVAGFLVTEKSSEGQHLGQTYYSCPICSQVFPLFSEVKTHVMSHSTEEMTSRQNLLHMDIKEEEKDFHSTSIPDFQSHSQIHVSDVRTQTSNLNAHSTLFNNKNKRFNQAVGIAQKNETNFGSKIHFSCLLCQEVFASVPKLKEHEQAGICSTKEPCAMATSTQNRSAIVESEIKMPENPPEAQVCSTQECSAIVTNTSVQVPRTAEKKCILISDFTKEGCQFIKAGKIYYSCLACPKVYVTFLEVRKHALDHIPGRKRYTCTVCLEGFDCYQPFKVHKLKHVPKVLEHKRAKNTISGKNYECSVCKQGFDLYHHLKYHRLKHVTERPFKCLICEKAFKVNSHLQEHIKIHSTLKKYKCDLCDYTARRPDRIEHHKAEVHAPVSTCMCKVCGKGFPSERYLRKHELVHTEATLKCHDCDKMFRTSSNLRSHQEIHNPNNVKTCTCEICGESFAKWTHLRSHIKRRHSERKVYSCEFCSKTLSTPGSLAIHRRMHTGEKPFSCGVCNKTFNAKNYLLVHSRVHTGEKPYKCEFCEKAFSQQSSLVSHKRYHTGIKPYACEVCPKSFVTKTLLTCHEKSHTSLSSLL